MPTPRFVSQEDLSDCSGGWVSKQPSQTPQTGQPSQPASCSNAGNSIPPKHLPEEKPNYSNLDANRSEPWKFSPNRSCEYTKSPHCSEGKGYNEYYKQVLYFHNKFIIPQCDGQYNKPQQQQSQSKNEALNYFSKSSPPFVPDQSNGYSIQPSSSCNASSENISSQQPAHNSLATREDTTSGINGVKHQS